jgi:hypothetical protein
MPQHEFIADTVWHEVAYGRNATTCKGITATRCCRGFPSSPTPTRTFPRMPSKAAASCTA